MTRSPAVTKEQCEAQLGPRGATSIGYEQRSVARKWLTAQGFPSAWACTLTFKQLNALYNRPDSDPEQWCISKAREQLADGSAVVATPKPATQMVQPAPALPASDDPRMAALQALLATMAPAPVVDDSKLAQHVKTQLDAHYADMVQDIVSQAAPDLLKGTIETLRKELPDLIPTTRIELKSATGETRKIEGYHHPKFADLLSAMACRQADNYHPNILLVGPTASGKTHAVQAAAKELGKEFFSNGALSMDYQLIGFRDAAGHYHETEFRRAFELPAVYLFDELDSSDNQPLLALAGALANGRFSFPDVIARRHPDCVIIGAANTWGYGATADFVGRNKLDAAIRSRFPVRISWDYDEKLERDISGNDDWAKRVQRARGKARDAGLKITIDPRMTQAGAGLIAGGMSPDKAATLTYLADLSPEQRKIVGE